MRVDLRVMAFGLFCILAVDIATPASSSENNGLPKMGDIATGCAVPQKLHGRKFYVDPVKGSAAGDGSKEHPWHTLAEIFDVKNRLFANAPTTWLAGTGLVKNNPNAPIHPGDIIYLMSGKHGKALLQGNFGVTTHLDGYDNNQFITVAAAPGQTPIIQQLTLKGVGKWVFSGLTFQSLQEVSSNQGKSFQGRNHTADYILAVLFGPNHDIVFDHDHFLSQADVSHWTAKDWQDKRVSGMTALSGKCLSITNNRFDNIGFAMGTQRGSNVLIENNIVDTFTDDGIDYGSSNLVIRGNRIYNAIEDSDGFHQDAMQGQPYGEVPVENVLIEDNIVVNQTKPLVSPANLQGIDTFDGVWKNVRVVNNIVAVNAFHGITYYGVDNLQIVNNTVVPTNRKVNTWIAVSPAKDNRPSSHVVVRNNLAAYYTIKPIEEFDHNMMVGTGNKRDVQLFKPDAHVFALQQPESLFEHYNTSFYAYDFNLLPSKAVGSGSPLLAPLTDLDGIPRNGIIDLGAMAYRGRRER